MLVGILLLYSLRRVSTLDRLLRPTCLVFQLLSKLSKVISPLDSRRSGLLLPTMTLHHDRSRLILLLRPRSQKGLLNRMIMGVL